MTIASQELLADIEKAVALFEMAVITFTEDTEGLTQEDLTDAYVGAEALIAKMKYAGAAIGQRAGKTMHSGDLVIRPAATIEKKVGTPRKAWNHKVLKSVVSEAILRKHTDPETGGMDCPPSTLIAEAFNTVSISAWKTTVCRPLGVNIDHYCEVSEPNVNLIVRWNGPRPGETSEDEDA